MRRLRREARLTQEELAEIAGISARSVSDLERGINATARKDTARRIADALNLAGDRREDFEAAAFGRTHAAAMVRTLPRAPTSFTGRDEELRQLQQAAADAHGLVEIHAIGGMAGVGKTALAVHAAYQAAGLFPDGQLFLPLHGHSAGQQPVTTEAALGTLLLAAGVSAVDIPADLAARTALWRARTAEKKLLVILDDAVSSEQVRPLMPGASSSLIIVTSRRRLIDLEDSRAINLNTLSVREAALLFVRLADRNGLEAESPQAAEIDRSAAIASLSLALDCFRALGNQVGEAGVLGYIAVVQHANGQYEAAAANQEQALALHRELGDRYGEANALNFLGAVQDSLGEYQAAAANQEQALALHRELGNRFGEANALHWIGCAQQGSRDLTAAATSQQHALDLYRELGYRMGEANVLNRMGSLAGERGDFDAGKSLLEQALTLFKQLGIVQGEAEVLTTMGELALADAREADARACHERAQVIAERIDLLPEQARALNGLAHCSLHRGDRGRAAATFHRALAIYQQLSPAQAQHVRETLRRHGLR
ncbi:MAG TPA: helix-turn-helix transcriptional regulator [Streptosporangiaceae bacterium]|nr:helix-turn-helix transcriptional regulator [Streptosporangiaceae bacterium]